MTTVERWDRRMLELARFISQWSKDPSTKVGAVIARMDYTVASVGFNGFPRDMVDDPALLNNREEKLKRVVHAEMNAILAAREPLLGYSLFVWPPGYGPTCERCAVHVLQTGISRVVHYHPHPTDEFARRWQASCEQAVSFYAEAGVEVVGYDQ